MLRIFGYLVFSHVNNGKLAPSAVKCLFLDFAYEFKGYRMWCPDSKKVIHSTDVILNENAMLSSMKESVLYSSGIGDQKDASRKVEIEMKTGTTQGGTADDPSRGVQATEPSSSITDPNQFQVEDDYSIARDCPRKEIKKHVLYVDSDGVVAYAFAIVAEEIIMKKVHTSENPTDMLTKPLLIVKFEHCLDLVGVHNM